MKYIKVIAIGFVTLLCMCSFLFAGNEARIGTTGAEQLNIPVGAQSIATAGAFISTLTGVESIYWNPAGLDRLGKSQAMVSYMNYIADINMTYIAISGSMGDLGSVALSIKTLDVGDIAETDVTNPDGTGATFSPSFLVAGLTYSKTLTDRISGGATVKFIHEGIMDLGANGFAIDFGSQYHFTNNLTLGVTLKNIGSNMRFSGGDLEQKADIAGANPTSDQGFFEAVTEKFSIPSTFQFGASYRYDIGSNNALTFAGTFVNANEAENNFRFGVEYNLNDLLYVRGGYDVATENTDESLFGFAFGAGLNYDIGGMNLQFDYAYRDVDVFDTNHVFTVKFGLGK
ncbi:MAG: PorV/PorQ family protein [bacterium]